MIELGFNQVEKYYGATKVLDNITFDINSGDRVALVGRNGAGKTTIFKIIAGIENYEKGIVSIRKGASIGYLNQIPDYPKQYTVNDVLNEAFTEILDIKRQINELEGEMALLKGEELQKVIKKYGQLQDVFEYKGGYQIDEKLNKVCTGLKIHTHLKERKFINLSGGEKTRIVLAQILLENPHILLLDEPTNHLDIKSVEWLEGFLREYKGTIFIISHDRYFLDNVVNKIIEIEDGNSQTYHGNYSYYVDEKERRLLEQLESYKNQQKKIKSMEEAIKRFKQWGAKADNPKMFKKAANMEKRIDKMEKIERPIIERANINLSFNINDRSGKDVINIENLRKSFNDKIILDNVNFYVTYGEKVAILGKNGSGKSTLIRIITNQYEPDGGTVKIGSRVKIGYLEQNITFKDEEQTVLHEIRNSLLVSEEKARRILAKFLFYSEDVFKKIKSLSGGEKTRLRLCQLMHQDINTLILDEPTNHLDIDSREMLEKALLQFQGTVIFISHDRYLINKLAQRVVEIENKTLTCYLGNYDYYKEKKEKRSTLAQEKNGRDRKRDKHTKSTNKTADKSKDSKKILIIEDEIKLLEGLIEEKNRQMDKFVTDYEKLNQLFKEKEELQNKLELLLEKWIDLNE